MLSLYHKSDSFLHRLSAGYKLLSLVGVGSLVFVFDTLFFSGSILALILALYRFARIPLEKCWRQIQPVIWLLGIIFLAQVFITGWEVACLIVVRFAALILAAGLVTLTTLTSDMIAAIEACLHPVRRWVAVEKVSLALSLAIRFIPVIADITHEVREAQRVRGLERNLFAVAVPVIIRTLKMGTQIAEALDARSFDSTPE